MDYSDFDDQDYFFPHEEDTYADMCDGEDFDRDDYEPEPSLMDEYSDLHGYDAEDCPDGGNFDDDYYPEDREGFDFPEFDE